MRCDLAAAFLHNPKIIYLDEPTIGLDITSKKRIRECIRETNRDRKTTIILTTHDMTDVEQLASRVMVINHGQMIYDGGLNGLQQKYRDSRTVVFIQKEKLQQDSFITVGKQKLELVHNENGFSVKVPLSVPIGEVIAQVMEKYAVEDIRIEELSVEDIIEEIYHQ